EIFVAQNDVTALLVLEAFNDLIGRDFFHVRLGNLFVFDRAEVAFAQLSKTELFFPGRRIYRNRDVDEAEADTALPSWTHNQSPFVVRLGAGLSISVNCEQLSITSAFRSTKRSDLPQLARFPRYFGGFFVFAHAEEDRLAKFPIAGPLRELDLSDEFGIHPAHFFHHRRSDSLDPFTVILRRKIDKRTVVAFFFAKFLGQDRQSLCRETASDFAGKFETTVFFFVFVVANEDRTEVFARAAGGRVAANYKLLLVETFQFNPGPAAPPRLIDGFALLADQSFQ